MGIIYKPPNTNIQEFSNTIIPIINKGNRDNKILYLMGDFNINLPNADTHGPTNDFINDMYAKCMFPLINKPTRITRYSATLIDNIYTNNISPNKVFCILTYQIIYLYNTVWVPINLMKKKHLLSKG